MIVTVRYAKFIWSPNGETVRDSQGYHLKSETIKQQVGVVLVAPDTPDTEEGECIVLVDKEFKYQNKIYQVTAVSPTTILAVVVSPSASEGETREFSPQAVPQLIRDLLS